MNDIVKNHGVLRDNLKERIKELDLSYTSIIDDAKKHGVYGITRSSLSKYFGNKEKGSITQEQLCWICIRYDVHIRIDVKLSPYNEEKCLDRLIKIFGK